ncbi:MAG TPA: methyl-accepting chemotaxis protein [Nitrospirota bacterium]|nr:methyl-accepting chemotaxis protein [Nitrospirota bacterium]
MKLFTDVAIGKRLGAGYAVILFLMLFVIAVGLMLLSSINDKLEHIVKVNGVKQQLSNDGRDAVNNIMLTMAKMLLVGNASSRIEEKKFIDEQRTRYKRTFEELEKLEVNDEGKKLISKVKDAVSSTREANNRVIELTMAGRTTEAAPIFVKESLSNSKAMDTAVGEIVSYNENRTNFRYEEAKQKYRITVAVFVVIAVLSILLVVYLGYAITRSITKPVASGVRFATEMSKGDLTQTLEIKQKDEVGVLAGSLQTMSGNLRSMFKDVTTGVQTLSSSSTELSAISQQMSAGTEQTSQKTKTVAAASEEMSTSMMTVASAMEQATTNLSSVATATEQMTSTVREIAGNAEKARNVTNSAVGKAASISDKVNDLGTAANAIGKITESISAISAQTNLLALNATIEAARAGAAGKGFAVVANEIKELAKQTATATEDIKTKIEAIQSSTQSNIAEVGEISGIIKEVNEIVTTIAAAIEEQSVATKDIARNIAQASQGIQEVNQNVAQSSVVSKQIASSIAEVNQASGEIASSGSQVQSSAEALSKLAEGLKAQVDRFKV